MAYHFHACQRTKKSSSKRASLSKLIHDYSIIQSEISQAIDRAFLKNSSGLREKLRQILFLSLLQQTHIKTIRLSGRKDSGRSSDTRFLGMKCRRITSRSRPTFSCASTETTSWLNSTPFPVTSPKRIDYTCLGSSLNPSQGLGECKRAVNSPKRLKS